MTPLCSPSNATAIVEGHPRGATETISDDVLHGHISTERGTIIDVGGFAEGAIRPADVMMITTDHDGSLGEKEIINFMSPEPYFTSDLLQEILIRRNTLQCRHNGRDDVSNHQPHDCLHKRLFRRRSKKTSRLRVTGLCTGNHRWPVNSPHKWPVTRKMFPFDDVIMNSFISGYHIAANFYSCHDGSFFVPCAIFFSVILQQYEWRQWAEWKRNSLVVEFVSVGKAIFSNFNFAWKHLHIAYTCSLFSFWIAHGTKSALTEPLTESLNWRHLASHSSFSQTWVNFHGIISRQAAHQTSHKRVAWWHDKMTALSALLALMRAIHLSPLDPHQKTTRDAEFSWMVAWTICWTNGLILIWDAVLLVQLRCNGWQPQNFTFSVPSLTALLNARAIAIRPRMSEYRIRAWEPTTWKHTKKSWWRHRMETFSALLALCGGNSPVTSEFPSQRPVTRRFDVFFVICAWTNGMVNNRDLGDLRRHRARYDVTVMIMNK